MALATRSTDALRRRETSDLAAEADAALAQLPGWRWHVAARARTAMPLTDSSGCRVRPTTCPTTECSNTSSCSGAKAVGESSTTPHDGSCTPTMHMKPSTPRALSSTAGSWLASRAATSLVAPSSLSASLHSSSLTSSRRAPVASACARAPLPSLQRRTRGGMAPALRTWARRGRSLATSLRAPAAMVRACSDEDSARVPTRGGRPPHEMRSRLLAGSEASRKRAWAHSSFVLTSPCSAPSSATSCLTVPTSPALCLAPSSSDRVRMAVAAASCRCHGL
mmetsp:Transcript_22648/g.57298  ORF Transcript_22648/g.57298 Transcript_22648/m.57298 type:complete len:279 (-) Transcript_22648:631-1467(-)